MPTTINSSKNSHVGHNHLPLDPSLEEMDFPSTPDHIWKRWGKWMDWECKVAEQATRKALDLPNDDMNINVDKSRKGIGALGAAGIALAASLIPGGALAWSLFNKATDNAVEKTIDKAAGQVIPQGTNTTNIERNVIEFYVRDGQGNITPVTVPRLSSQEE